MASSDTRDKYWDVDRTLSHNCLFNFIISARGGGKSYGSLKRVVDNYLKGKRNGRRREFVYVRRTEEEMRSLCISRGGRLFNAVRREFPGHVLTAEAKLMSCDKDVFGYALPLSTAHKAKSDSFPFVDTIIFDEFIAPKGGRYLPDEITKFLELYETVARPGTDHPDVTVLFLGNAVSQTNPYFEYFRLAFPYAGEFRKFGANKDILVQDVSVPVLQEAKKQTRFGRIIDGSEYADYAIDNKWLEDSEEFLGKKTKDSTYRMSIKYNGEWIGVWFDDVEWVYYISNDINLQDVHKFAVTTDDHQPNMMLLKSAKNMNSFRHLIQCYNSGAVRYETISLKKNFREIMRLLVFSV